MFTTFLINLEKDKDRLVFMDTQLTKLGINYRRQIAVLGKEYQFTKEEYDEALSIKTNGYTMLPGEVGCALSHTQVLQKIVDESIPYTLVLEDDVLLPENFKALVEGEIIKNKNNTWEYLLFDYVIVGWSFVKQWFFGVRYGMIEKSKVSKAKALAFIIYSLVKGLYIIPLSFLEGFRNWYKQWFPGPVRFFRPVYFAGAYLLSLEGAKKLHSLTKPILYTADHLPNRARVLRGLRFRGFAPQSVHQQKKLFGSSILDKSGSEI
jgi:GR25 family glycosyltransferase involved in LPS biosynthesis